MSSVFLTSKAALQPLNYVSGQSLAWLEHTPFALALVDAIKPRLFVELGTHWGDSYFAFCQAVAVQGGQTSCVAVDHWLGDAHSGEVGLPHYAEDIYSSLMAAHDPMYAQFSRLLRSSFDDAVLQFADGSIDLLHIDGLHTYEAVRHDFETWLPKLSDRAVVLFHDTQVHTRDFGVTKYWSELTVEYPHFEFEHGHGLGVLAVGLNAAPPVLDLCKLDAAVAQHVKSFYAIIGAGVATRGQLLQLKASLAASVEQTQALTVSLSELETKCGELTIECARSVAKEAQVIALIDKAYLEIRSLDAEREVSLRATTARLDSAQKQIQDLKVVKEAAERAVAAAVTHQERIETKAAEIQQALNLAREKLSAVHASTSWRLTEPLRRTKIFANKARSHLKLLSTFHGANRTARLRKTLMVATIVRKHLKHPTSLPRKFSYALQVVNNGGLHALKQAILKSVNNHPMSLAPRSTSFEECHANTFVIPLDTFKYQPKISIITPVYNVEPVWLERAISSVQAQTYENWEMCVCDDGSNKEDTIQVLRRAANLDSRVRVIYSTVNGGISRATNQAIAIATGDYVCFLDNDDEIAPHALASYVSVLNQYPATDVIYCDEDKLSIEGNREEPFLKPDWSPHFLREVMYVGHLLMVRRSLVAEIGGLDSIYDGVQDFELMLRLSEKTRNIHHVRDVLYHWRRVPGSVAHDTTAKSDLSERQAKAVTAHLARQGVDAFAKPNPRAAHRAIVVPAPRVHFPRISIVIPTKDAPIHITRCLDSLFRKTTYPNFEVVVIDNKSTDPAAIQALKRASLLCIQYDQKFNFSKVNNLGVAHSTGDIVVLLNNDTEICEPDWLEQMLFLLEQPGISAVGPMLVYPDSTVQHAGIALGMRGTADHVMRGMPKNADGYFGSLNCTREVSGVTFACVMMRRSDYLTLGGLREMYATHYQDVDFCLRIRQSGGHILYTPRTHLIHHESATRGKDYDILDRALLIDAWGHLISAGDPYARWELTAQGKGTSSEHSFY